MAKRKLNRQQRWRIEKIQEERRQRAQRKVERDHPVASALGDEQTGVVVAHFGQQVLVEADAGERRRCHFRATLEQLVVGDRVIWQAPRSEGDGVVTALSPRVTVLKRPDNYGNLKPVAANVARLLVVFAPRPTPSTALLDRYLVAAELSGIEALLVLNKADLMDDDNRDLLARIDTLYRDLGYPVIHASARDGQGLDQLNQALAGHTCVFVGQSGVGKSSLINAVLPEAELDVGALSEVSGLGQHTTTTARLFHLPGGGDLIDSPGIREFGLWHISEEELLHGYRELSELAGHCRFRNCTHRHEPGCALREAAESGQVSAERLANFFQIADTLDEEGRARYQS
ncbi:small ribosomal subunit biogenesis GTPase RsgA [Alloalcanivorax mobilis]|uniref:small ribosomal subunit biogenesis GTPase RsgA n=1 Tax=Alloalcanivorax mobilis TaxID=2019569 RepID=UPI000B5B3A55|nr:small ribosomal subunit biogenesis GTPase RsgA [Alloalcanivorax mobilis]ASK35441.1 ribosome biogenesis GTPase RsgA [Alcanivorax sp. N3-2A]|tara:strand:+ start:42258 stop:43289 length:1032 start_codon:yes stop_codon:yes gene_type:complete